MNANIPESALPRVLIVGGGFAGLKLAQSLDEKLFQVVLLDKNNYHQFPPLIYQVASSGLEPSSIAFPFRAALSKKKNFFFRLGLIERVEEDKKLAHTSIGAIAYDYLVLSCGATTNFFGNENIRKNAIPMKSLYESMNLRNRLLQTLEQAMFVSSDEERKALLNLVIVGAGPTGVEIAGAIAEMKRYIIPKDYPDLPSDMINIKLLDAAPRVLSAMSEKSSAKALKYLQSMGVEVMLNQMAKDYDGEVLTLANETQIKTKTLIWVSGIVANSVEGLEGERVGRGCRLVVDRHNQLLGSDSIFVLGDQSIITGDPKYPNGHPQMAQIALQQASQLAKNLKAEREGKKMTNFEYKDLGSMATVGRNKAVAEIGKLKWGGLTAWLLWLVVHLRSILSVRNKLVVLFNWIWNYLAYNRSLRLILKRNIPIEPHEV